MQCPHPLRKDQGSDDSLSIQEHQCTWWANKNWAQMKWILWEGPGTPLWCLQPMGKCTQTRKHKYTFTTYIYLFVTVQLLDDTPAVLSLGKLFEDHGYFFECVSGQQPRVTKEEKTIVCKTDNFAPLVVPGLSSNPASSSSSASLSQDSLRKEAERATRELVPPASSSSSSSVSKRSDELATRALVPLPKTHNQYTKKEWQEGFERSVGRSSWLVEGFQRKSERNRIACIRTQFFGIRSGIPYDSGNEIEDARYLYSLPKRQRLRRYFLTVPQFLPEGHFDPSLYSWSFDFLPRQILAVFFLCVHAVPFCFFEVSMQCCVLVCACVYAVCLFVHACTASFPELVFFLAGFFYEIDLLSSSQKLITVLSSRQWKIGENESRAKREEKKGGAKHFVCHGRSSHDLRQIADRMLTTILPCLCVFLPWPHMVLTQRVFRAVL